MVDLQTDFLASLTQQLLLQQAYQRLWANQDFQELLKTLSHHNKWLNPQEFKDSNEFMRAYNVMWARARVAQEIEDLLTQAPKRVKDIRKRLERENAKRPKETTPTK